MQIVDEQIIAIPAAGISVVNRARKILFFHEANCRHLIEEIRGSEVELEAGDILVLPHPCRQFYSPIGLETVRAHAVRLVLEPELVPPLTAPESPPRGGFQTGSFSSHQVGSSTASRPGNSIAEWAMGRFDRAVHLRGGVTAEMRETLARLRREAEGVEGERAPGYRLRAGALCLELLVLVARQMEGPNRGHIARGASGAFRVESAREFIERHLDTPLSLGAIASYLGISPEHLARQWKSATGTTIFDAVRSARIERAKSLLTASDLNISQIASACGFSSLALFSRTFKANTGVSPLQYRERLTSWKPER